MTNVMKPVLNCSCFNLDEKNGKQIKTKIFNGCETCQPPFWVNVTLFLNEREQINNNYCLIQTIFKRCYRIIEMFLYDLVHREMSYEKCKAWKILFFLKFLNIFVSFVPLKIIRVLLLIYHRNIQWNSVITNKIISPKWLFCNTKHNETRL